jgi:ferredoxin/flavodoxin
MSLLRALLGRRQFLAGSASSVLALGLGKFARAVDAIFQTSIARKPARGIVVYYSATGNTAQIAKAIHRGMKSVIPCDIVPIKKMDPKKMAKYDIMAIGSPNWYMREVAVCRTFTDDMPRMDGKHCVIFGTHGGQPFGQFCGLSRNPIKKGMTVIGWSDWFGADFVTPHQTVPHPAWGHPDSVDLAEAEAYGKQMAEYSIRIYAGEKDLIPELPRPDAGTNTLWAPITSPMNGKLVFSAPPPDSIPQFDLSKCVYPRCTQCSDNCPVNAIDLSVMASAGAVTPADAVVTQDAMFAQDWTKHPTIGQNYPVVVKNACVHCGGLCQRVCRYDAIAYFGEKIQIKINSKKCTYPKCTICSDLCPQTAIDLTKNPPVIHNNCEAEGLCWGVCPYNAIEIPNMAEVQLKKAWWFKDMFKGMGGPGGGPAMGGPGGGGGAMSHRGSELASYVRFRDLVRQEDNDKAFGIMYVTSYPRVPIKKDLFPYETDENR